MRKQSREDWKKKKKKRDMQWVVSNAKKFPKSQIQFRMPTDPFPFNPLPHSPSQMLSTNWYSFLRLQSTANDADVTIRSSLVVITTSHDRLPPIGLQVPRWVKSSQRALNGVVAKRQYSQRQNSKKDTTSQLEFRSEWRISQVQGHSVKLSFR